MILLLDFLCVRFRFIHPLVNRGYQAGIINAEDFDYRITLAKFLDAILDAETPCLLVPRDAQGRIAIAIVRNVDFRLNSRHGFNELCDAINAAVPFVVKFFGIGIQPGFDRSQEPMTSSFPTFMGRQTAPS